MDYLDKKQAYCLAVTYGFCPPHAVYPARIRNTNPGKFEADCLAGQPIRTMILAHFADATNILIKYTPAELEF